MSTEIEKIVANIEKLTALLQSDGASALNTEEILSSVAAYTESPETAFNADLLESLGRKCITLLDIAAQRTWYCCDCGPVSPLSGMIDVMCPKCGGIRHLPPRLSRSPWPLYIACARRVNPDGWFDALANAMIANKSAEIISSASSDSDASIRVIRCIDNMQIDETGNIRGLAWIALPMPMM